MTVMSIRVSARPGYTGTLPALEPFVPRHFNASVAGDEILVRAKRKEASVTLHLQEWNLDDLGEWLVASGYQYEKV